MNAYSCREIINTENLDRIIKAKRLDTGQLTQLQRLRKRLKEHDGYAHKVDFALNPQERRGRLYPKRGASSVQGLKRDVRKALTHDSYTDIDMVNAHPCILSHTNCHRRSRKVSWPGRNFVSFSCAAIQDNFTAAMLSKSNFGVYYNLSKSNFAVLFA